MKPKERGVRAPIHQAWSSHSLFLNPWRERDLQNPSSWSSSLIFKRDERERRVGWRDERMRERTGNKITWEARALIWPATYRKERENVIYFVWSKMLVGRMWVPRYDPIAQCFKHEGTFILMYIIKQHHFHKLLKIIYQN